MNVPLLHLTWKPPTISQLPRWVHEQVVPIEGSNIALPKDESSIAVKSEGIPSTSTLEQGQAVEVVQGIVKPTEESKVELKSVEITAEPAEVAAVEAVQETAKPAEESDVEFTSSVVDTEPAEVAADESDQKIAETTKKDQVKSKTAKSLDISAEEKSVYSTAEKAVKSGDEIKVGSESESLKAPAGRSTFGATPTPFQSNFGTLNGPGFDNGLYRSPLAGQSYYSSGFGALPGYTSGFNNFGQNRYDPAFNRGFGSFGFGAKESTKSSDTPKVDVKSVSSEASADAATAAVKSAVADNSPAKAPGSNSEAAAAGVTSPFQTKLSSPVQPGFGSGYRSPFGGQSYYPSTFGAVSGPTPTFNNFGQNRYDPAFNRGFGPSGFGQSYYPSTFGAVSGPTPTFNNFGQNRYDPAFNRGFGSFGFGAQESTKSSDTPKVDVKSVSSEASADAATAAVKSAVADDSPAKAPGSNSEAATAGVTSPFQTKLSSPVQPGFGSGYRSPFGGQSYYPSTFGAVSGPTPTFNNFGQNRYDPAFNRGFGSFGFGAKESTKSSETAKVEAKVVSSETLTGTAKTAAETAPVKDNAAPTGVQTADTSKSTEAYTPNKDNSPAQVPASDTAKFTVESDLVPNSPIDGVANSGAAVQSVPVTSDSSANVLSSGVSKAAVQSTPFKDYGASLTASSVGASLQSNTDSSLKSPVATAAPSSNFGEVSIEAAPAKENSIAKVASNEASTATNNVATPFHSKFGSADGSAFGSNYRPAFYNPTPYGAAPGYNREFNTFGYNKYNPTAYPGYSSTQFGAQGPVKSADAPATVAKPVGSEVVSAPSKESSPQAATGNVAASTQSKFGSSAESTFIPDNRPAVASQSYNQYPVGAAPFYNTGSNTFGYNKYNPTAYPGYSFTPFGAQGPVKSADAPATVAKPVGSEFVSAPSKESSPQAVTGNVATSSQSKFGSSAESTSIADNRPAVASQSYNQYPVGAAPFYNTGSNTFGYNKYNPTAYPGYSFTPFGAQGPVKSADAPATVAKPVGSEFVSAPSKESSPQAVTGNVATSSQSKFGSSAESTSIADNRPAVASQSYNQYPVGAAPFYNTGSNTFGYNKYNPTAYPGYSFTPFGAQGPVKSADAPATVAKPVGSEFVSAPSKESSPQAVTGNVATSSQSKFGSSAESTSIADNRPAVASQSYNQYPVGAAPFYNTGSNTFGYNKYNPTAYPGYSFTPFGAQGPVKSADAPATVAKPVGSEFVSDSEKAPASTANDESPAKAPSKESSPQAVTGNVATSSQSKFGSSAESTSIADNRPAVASQSYNQYPVGAAPFYNTGSNTFGYNKYNPTAYPGYSFTPFGAQGPVKSADAPATVAKPVGSEFVSDSEKAPASTATDESPAKAPSKESSPQAVTGNVATSSQSKFGSSAESTSIADNRPAVASQSYNQYPVGAAPFYNTGSNTFGYNKYNPTAYPGYNFTPFGTKESTADKVSSEVKATSYGSPAESANATNGCNNAKNTFHFSAFGSVFPYTTGYNAYNNAIGNKYGPNVHTAYPGFGSHDGSYRYNSFYGKPKNHQGYQGYFGADYPAHPFGKIADSRLPAGVNQQYYIDHPTNVPYLPSFQSRTGALTPIPATFTDTKPTSSSIEFNREK
ncbi:mucin-19-like [Diprion similis]|uniref:mucin-19-like n=1 Tax=Diprion similis TaxID=362088 RepID=UPI001EF79214|nr:mucin-19-like [Diprion similis]